MSFSVGYSTLLHFYDLMTTLWSCTLITFKHYAVLSAVISPTLFKTFFKYNKYWY